MAKGELLLFLNNDTAPLAGWLEPMVELIERHPTIGIVGSKLLYPDGRIQHAGVIVKEINRNGDLGLEHIHRFDDAAAPWVNRATDLQCVTGACMMIRRAMFEDVNGFDEQFTNGYEDVDLCFKVRAMGFRVCYCPASVLTHHESITEGRNDKNEQNWDRLNERWRGKIRPDERENYDAAGKIDLFELNQAVAQMRVSLKRIEAHKQLLSQISGKAKPGRVLTVKLWLAKMIGLPDLAKDIEEVRRFLSSTQRALIRLGRILARWDERLRHPDQEQK